MKDEAWLRQQLWSFYLEMQSAEEKDFEGLEPSKNRIERNQNQTMSTYCDKILNWL